MCVVYFDPYTIIYTNEAQTIKMEKTIEREKRRNKKKYKKLIKSIFNYVCGFGLIVQKIQTSFVSFATIKNIFKFYFFCSFPSLLDIMATSTL